MIVNVAGRSKFSCGIVHADDILPHATGTVHATCPMQASDPPSSSVSFPNVHFPWSALLLVSSLTPSTQQCSESHRDDLGALAKVGTDGLAHNLPCRRCHQAYFFNTRPPRNFHRLRGRSTPNRRPPKSRKALSHRAQRCRRNVAEFASTCCPHELVRWRAFGCGYNSLCSPSKAMPCSTAALVSLRDGSDVEKLRHHLVSDLGTSRSGHCRTTSALWHRASCSPRDEQIGGETSREDDDGTG